MAKDGLVKKTKESNGKKFQINITPEGKKINQKVTETSLQIVFSSLSAKEKVELANCLLPLLEKARYLLGMPQTTRFIRSISVSKSKRGTDSKSTKPLPLPDYDLWILFDQVGFAISRLREIELTQFGLTLPQTAILYALQIHEGSMTIAEMEDYTMRQPLSMFLLVNRMEKSGLISQTKNHQGKKSNLVITKQGKELYSQVTTASNDLIFSTLSNKELKQLAEFLDVLLERARYLLGINYVPPILKYLANVDKQKKSPRLDVN
jgi:DNA-binding MarR family transcriptional regulator